QMRQGLVAYRATGSEIARSYYLGLSAQAYGRMGQPEEGLSVLTEALAQINKTEERFYEAELYRIQGELTLQQVKVQSSKVKEAEAKAGTCFLKAIKIARQQQAKSLELRATVSLARLWQRQSKLHEARQMLSTIYDWFTEGFDTADLQEAKALLASLESGV